MRFLVLRGRGNPGNIECRYSIFDVVETSDTNVDNQLRKYSYRTFYNMGARAKTMREMVYKTKKNVPMGDVNFCDPVDVYHHSHTYLMFVPMSAFLKWGT
jgi:hypothetical protein